MPNIKVKSNLHVNFRYMIYLHLDNPSRIEYTLFQFQYYNYNYLRGKNL